MPKPGPPVHKDPSHSVRAPGIQATKKAHSCATCGRYPPEHPTVVPVYHTCINPHCHSKDIPVISCSEHPPKGNVCRICNLGTMVKSAKTVAMLTACPACDLLIAAKTTSALIAHITGGCPSHKRLCSNAPNGCPEQVTVSSLDDHLQTCAYNTKRCDICGYSDVTVVHNHKEHLLAQLAEKFLAAKGRAATSIEALQAELRK